VALHDVLRPPSLAEFNDVYLVYELMDTDLHQIIALTGSRSRTSTAVLRVPGACCHLVLLPRVHREPSVAALRLPRHDMCVRGC
jgi:hypothetical protein